MTLHVESTGSGSDLVLVHGWGTHCGIWSELAALLGAHFRVHCVDLPGHGASPSLATNSIDSWAAALARALPPNAIVCGWSLGAQVALACAHAHARQVAKLVLIAATPRFVQSDDWMKGVEPHVFEAFSAGLERDPRALVQRFAALQAQGDARARDVVHRLRDGARENAAPAGLTAGLEILKESDLRSVLTEINQSTLVLHGAEDRLVPLAAAEYLARHLPHAKLAVIAGAAHAPFIGREREIARQIEEFCL